jgi:protocatechuate 3,4-dioxygenase beta subunit
MRARFSLLSFAFASLLAVPTFAAVTGAVMNADGAPIGNAKVSLLAPETIDARRQRWQSKTPERTPLSTVTTGTNGAFSLDTPKGQPLLDLRIDAAGFAPMVTRVLPDEELGALALTPAPLKSGIITSSNGKPAAGALVIWASEAESVTRTDDAGKYSVPDPDKWASRLLVFHPDFAPLEEATGAFATKKGVNRTLVSGVAVRGRVVAADGTTPVANASIVVDGWPLATSGENGAFAIAHAAPQWEVVSAFAGDRATMRAHANGDVLLKLAKAGSVSGIVRDAKSQPLAGVEVRLAAPPPGIGAPSRTAFTDAKGAYTLAPLVAGQFQLLASRPGYNAGPALVSLQIGQALQKPLFLTELARVSGTVVDEDKRPVAGARVTARPESRQGMMFMMGRFGGGNTPAATGPDGRYVLRAVDPGPEVVAEALKRGQPGAKTAAMKLAAGERKSGVNLTLPRGIAFSGKVLDGNGKAVSGVAVDATPSQGDMGGGMVRRMVIGGARGNDDQLVRTGSDGTFTIKVKEGTYDVNFKREGFAFKNLRGQQVSTTSKPVEVTLEPGVEITGRVTRGGAPVEAVNVSAVSQEGFVSTQSAPDGTFRLEDLTPGSYMLSVNKQDAFIQTMRTANAPARDVNIELPLGGRISGHVTDKTTHKPVTNFQAGVTTSRGGGGMVIMTPPMLRGFTTDDGSFTLENVPPGQTQLVVNAAGYTSGKVPGLNIEDGKAIDNVDVGLDTGVKLTGRVTGPDGAPLAGVNVRLDDTQGGGRTMRPTFGADGNATTDPNGDYTIEALEAGEKTFNFSMTGYLTETKSVNLAGRETRLDAQLGSGQHVSGVVVTDAGSPVADAEVSAQGASAGGFGFGGRSVHTDAGGNFALEGLAPGHYTFAASKSGYATGMARDFDISLGAPVRIIMKSGGIITGHVTGLTPSELSTATVSAQTANGGTSAPVDASGNFRIEGAPLGTVRVGARTGGMGMGSGAKSTPIKSVEVAAGGSATVDLEFKNDTVIRGRVTRGGKPMATAMVIFMPKNAKASTNASASTDGSGNYELSGLEDAPYNVQVVDMERITPFTVSYEVKGSGTFDIDITGSTLRGRVLDATTGEPLSDAHVDVRPSGSESAFFSSRGAQTDAAGNFSLEWLASGSYSVTATKSGYGNEAKDITVGVAGAPEVELKLASSGGGLTLKVVDGRDGRLLFATVSGTDSQGHPIDPPMPFFRSGSPEPVKLDVAPGSYRLTITAQGYASRVVTMSAPSEQTVALTPGGTIVVHSRSSAAGLRGRLIDASGMVYIRNAFGQTFFTLDAAPGATTINNVAAGVYRLEVLDQTDHIVGSASVTVIDGQSVDVPV